MADLSYVNFDVTITPQSGGHYAVDVVGEGGQPSGPFQDPFTPTDLDELRQIVEGPVRDVMTSSSQRSRSSDYREKVRLFGERLYDAVFVNNVRSSLAMSLQNAQQKGSGVRIRLHLDTVPELAALPWEYLYDRDTQTHLALSEVTPIVRHLNLPGPASSILIKPPLNVLVMIADPKDYPRLASEKEWQKIEEALRPLIQAKLVSLTLVPRGTVSELQNSLQQTGCHIFHFIGHGGFENKEAALLLEDHQGKGNPLTTAELNVALGHSNLRLVVLNSCDGAYAGPEDPFAGLAQGLVRSRIPAVVAMQFKITDNGAIKFAEKFYNAIANNLPIDRSLAEARKAMFLHKNPTEWGTPVLFMRGNDGRLFQIDRPTEQQMREMQIKALAEDAISAINASQFDIAIQRLNDAKKLQQPAQVL